MANKKVPKTAAPAEKVEIVVSTWWPTRRIKGMRIKDLTSDSAFGGEVTLDADQAKYLYERLRRYTARLRARRGCDMAKNRKMSEAELDAYLNNLNTAVGQKLNEIRKLMPPGYKITLVCRHEQVDKAHMIFTDDSNLEGVANAVLGNNNTRGSKP